MPTGPALGIAAIASLMISPYAYDYDMLIPAVGIALLLPTLRTHGRLGEKIALCSGFVVAAGTGVFLLATWPATALPPHHNPIPLAFAALALCFAISMHVAMRSRPVSG